MIIKSEFQIEQTVYLKTDRDQWERLVTEISVSANGILYSLTCGTCRSWHFAFEITTEKNVLVSSTN